MQLLSNAFRNEQNIPKRFTGEGENTSPPLFWIDIPKGVKSFALTCEDPDALDLKQMDKSFVHWLIYGISPTSSFITEGIPKQETLDLPFSVTQGLNSFGKIGYDGPMPPVGNGLHHYIFSLYALGATIEFDPGLSKDEFIQLARGKILQLAKLTGTYERRINQKETYSEQVADKSLRFLSLV